MLIKVLAVFGFRSNLVSHSACRILHLQSTKKWIPPCSSSPISSLLRQSPATGHLFGRFFLQVKPARRKGGRKSSQSKFGHQSWVFCGQLASPSNRQHLRKNTRAPSETRKRKMLKPHFTKLAQTSTPEDGQLKGLQTFLYGMVETPSMLNPVYLSRLSCQQVQDIAVSRYRT